MARARLYSCPSCKMRFESNDVTSGKCPHCGVPIKATQVTIDKRLITEYIVNTERRLINPHLPIEIEDTDYGQVVSQPGQSPIIHLRVKERKYTVLYKGSTINVGWEYCPECGQKLFQNVVLNGWVEQEHVCRKCKAKVVTIYRK